MNYFAWQPGVNAPAEYPMEIYRAYFYHNDDIMGIPSGVICETGWGEDGMNMMTSHQIPNGLKITYLSFVENKFFTGDFALQEDTILALFQKGYMRFNTKEWDTYSSIIVNMAPGGMVVVWLSGGEGYQVEIGRYQAEETQVNWMDFNPTGMQDKNRYISETLNESTKAVKNLKEKGIQYDLYDRYRVKHTWRVKMYLPEGFKINDIGYKMFNGEQETLFDANLKENEFLQRAVPKFIDVVWYDASHIKHGASIYFEGNEIFEAFEQIYKKDPDAEMEILLKMNVADHTFDIFLQTATEEIQIEQARVRMYSINKKFQD